MGRADDGMKCMEVRSLLKKGDYEEALKVADTIDIDRVKSIVDLKILASAYERVGQYENAKYVLLKSYHQKHSKMTIYRLAYLSIKTGEFDDAEELYQEFSELAPNSPDRYILRYGIDRAKNVDYVLRIATLQKLKQIEYTEEWGYELAKIYHKAGLHEDCIRECQDLIIWFGSGIIVDKARLLCKYHEEGKAALEAYGVLDENLSVEELEERREQFFDDTSDLNQQQESIEEARLRKLVERDFEKTVNLHQILKEEGEDIDLLKKEVHRVWGQTSEEMISQSRQQEWDAQHGEMEPIMDHPMYTGDTEQMLADSMAQLMEEEVQQGSDEMAYGEWDYEGEEQTQYVQGYPDMEEILPDEYPQGEIASEQYLEESIPEEYIAEEYASKDLVSEPEFNSVEEVAQEEQEKVQPEPEKEKETGARAFLSKRQAKRAARREKRRKAKEEKRKLQEQNNDGYVTERVNKEESAFGVKEQTIRVALKPGSETAEAAILARVRNKMAGDNSENAELENLMEQPSNELIIDGGLDAVEDWMPEEQEAVSGEAGLVEDMPEEQEEASEKDGLEDVQEEQEEISVKDAPEEQEEIEPTKLSMEQQVENGATEEGLDEEQPDETVATQEEEGSKDSEETAQITEGTEEEEENQFRNTYGAMLWEYFEKYQHDTRLCEDAYDALEGAMAKQQPVHYVLTCKNKERAAEFTKEFAKALHRLGLSEKPQVAVTNAEKLNFMHLEQKYEKLQGGILLVQGAKKMTPDTVQSIMNMCSTLQGKITVILTDARPYLMDLIDEYPMMKRFFPYDISMR